VGLEQFYFEVLFSPARIQRTKTICSWVTTSRTGREVRRSGELRLRFEAGDKPCALFHSKFVPFDGQCAVAVAPVMLVAGTTSSNTQLSKSFFLATQEDLRLQRLGERFQAAVRIEEDKRIGQDRRELHVAQDGLGVRDADTKLS
jgi:hypothetical protein